MRRFEVLLGREKEGGEGHRLNEVRPSVQYFPEKRVGKTDTEVRAMVSGPTILLDEENYGTKAAAVNAARGKDNILL